MAFESDDEKAPDAKRKRDSDADGGGLGALSAELPRLDADAGAGDRSDDAEDAIDASALAALSKGKPGQPAAADDAEGSRVKLAGAAALATERSSSRPPPAANPSQPSAASRWIVPLSIGFALGIPTGGFLFSNAPEPAEPRAETPAPQPASPSAAEMRARAADQAAAAIHLPSKREPAAVAPAPQPAAAEATAAQPAAAEAAQPAPTQAPTAQPAVAQPGAAAPAAARAAAPAKAPGAPIAAARAPSAAPAVASAPATATAATSAPVAPAASPQPAAAPAAPPGQPDPRTVDELLDDALASSNARKAAERADRALEPAALPMTPSREDVTRAMTVLLPAIRGCAAGRSGLANVGIVVRNDGRVENVSVTGAPFEGDRTGRCMEGVVRRAKFPRFQQAAFRVQFPFAIQ